MDVEYLLIEESTTQIVEFLRTSSEPETPPLGNLIPTQNRLKPKPSGTYPIARRPARSTLKGGPGGCDSRGFETGI
jgi:hypothetical protein